MPEREASDDDDYDDFRVRYKYFTEKKLYVCKSKLVVIGFLFFSLYTYYKVVINQYKTTKYNAQCMYVLKWRMDGTQKLLDSLCYHRCLFFHTHNTRPGKRSLIKDDLRL